MSWNHNIGLLVVIILACQEVDSGSISDSGTLAYVVCYNFYI